MKKVFILHLLPLEYYPPITNLLDVLATDNTIQTHVFSTYNNKKRKVYQNNNSRIIRGKYPAYTKHKLVKISAYFSTFIKPLWYLIKFKPDVLLYIEPHSSLPAYIYKRFFNPTVKLCIHHHEYYTPEDFKAPAMKSVRFFHNLEIKYLFKKAIWISQTNIQRLNLLKADYPFIKDEVLQTLANYPPLKWKKQQKTKKSSTQIKLLYIGSLSFENTFIKEIVDFVNLHNDKLCLTIYAYNIQTDIIEFLENQDNKVIKFYQDGIDYERIPEIACEYDIGLILYKGHNLNYIYNAPNKLFEYLACGLNVWFPDVMEGCKPYINIDSRPFIKDIDFSDLNSSIILPYEKSLNLPSREYQYYCENELERFIQTLKTGKK